MEKMTLDISWSSVLKVVVTLSALYLVFLVHDILILTVFGLIIAILFEWPVRNLSKKMPRGLAIIFIYSIVFGSLVLMIFLSISSLASEIKEFVKLLPFYFEQVSPPLAKLGFEAFRDIETFTEYLDELSVVMGSNILNILFYIFGGVAATLYMMSVSIFMILEGESVKKGLRLLFPHEDKEKIAEVWSRSEKKVGIWFVRVLVGSVFLGLASYVVFLLMGIEYPVSLAILAGMANLIPMVGPVIGTGVLFAVIALDSVSKAVFVSLIYGVLQQIENNIIGPLLIKRFAGLSPTLIIISLAIGAKLSGALGAILMVPLVGVAVEFIKGLLQKKEVVTVD